MLSLVILYGVCCGLATVHCGGDMGPGLWKVNYINTCEETTHIFKFDIAQEKINRTHNGFYATLQLDEPFTEDFAMRADICKFVDGGCKQYQVISDNSFVKFCNKYAKNNVKTALEMAKVDPPEFPIEAGEYEVKGYIFDYTELPSDAVYGEFIAKCYLLQENLEVGCLEINLEFYEDDEECDE